MKIMTRHNNELAAYFLYVLLILVTMLSACSKHSLKENKDTSLKTELVAPVQSLQLNKELDLPGQMLAYQDVPIHAKVEGFISWIGVDRGSIVKKGQKLITVYCPELESKYKESVSKLQSSKGSYEQSIASVQSQKSKLIESKARLDADQLTYERLQIAARTPGAVAQNEVDIAEKTMEADRARVQSLADEVKAAEALVCAQKDNVQAAKSVVDSFEDMRSYLTITAPFDGVITERNVHEGSVVAVDALRTNKDLPLVRIQEKSLLRLVVPVPEACVSGLKIGNWVEFTVPAFLGRTFKGQIARLGFALDEKTRTMPVEMNVYNDSGELEPGMFATVRWPVVRPVRTLFVPSSAVVSNLKETFVVLVRDSKTMRVPIKRGMDMANLVEVAGDLKAGEIVMLRGTDEYPNGASLLTKIASPEEVQLAAGSSSAGGD